MEGETSVDMFMNKKKRKKTVKEAEKGLKGGGVARETISTCYCTCLFS